MGADLLHQHGPRFNSSYNGIFVPGVLVGFHGYYNETEIASVGRTVSTAAVYEELLRRPTPAARVERPVRTGDRTRIPGLGAVRHVVVPSERMVLNITDDPHLLSPGAVVRFVFQRDGSVFIGSFGEGMGALPVLNGLGAPATWRAVDDDIAKRFCR